MPVYDDDAVIDFGIQEFSSDPAKIFRGLVGDRNTRTNPRVHEQIVSDRQIVQKAAQKVPVLKRNAPDQINVQVRQTGAIDRRGARVDPIAPQRGRAAIGTQPFSRAGAEIEKPLESFFVVSAQVGSAKTMFEDQRVIAQPIDYTPAVGAAIDIVTEIDDVSDQVSGIAGIFKNRLLNGLKEVQPSVNVADDIQAKAIGHAACRLHRC